MPVPSFVWYPWGFSHFKSGSVCSGGLWISGVCGMLPDWLAFQHLLRSVVCAHLYTHRPSLLRSRQLCLSADHTLRRHRYHLPYICSASADFELCRLQHCHVCLYRRQPCFLPDILQNRIRALLGYNPHFLVGNSLYLEYRLDFSLRDSPA